MSTKERENIITPAAPAFIMAFGILLIGAIEVVSFFNNIKFILITIFICLFFIVYFSLTYLIFRWKFFISFLKDPVTFFLTGTWLAGISIFSQVILKFLPNFSFIVHLLTIIQLILITLFFILSVRNMYKLFSNDIGIKVNGVLLLSTVAIQSTVIFFSVFFLRCLHFF